MTPRLCYLQLITCLECEIDRSNKDLILCFGSEVSFLMVPIFLYLLITLFFFKEELTWACRGNEVLTNLVVAGVDTIRVSQKYLHQRLNRMNCPH